MLKKNPSKLPKKAFCVDLSCREPLVRVVAAPKLSTEDIESLRTPTQKSKALLKKVKSLQKKLSEKTQTQNSMEQKVKTLEQKVVASSWKLKQLKQNHSQDLAQKEELIAELTQKANNAGQESPSNLHPLQLENLQEKLFRKNDRISELELELSRKTFKLEELSRNLGLTKLELESLRATSGESTSSSPYTS